jgi:hypothetical protein
MCQSDLKMTSLDGRGRRQHREEVGIVGDAAAVPQLGRVGNDAADPSPDERPAADRVRPHQLADPQGERDVASTRRQLIRVLKPLIDFGAHRYMNVIAVIDAGTGSHQCI